MGNNTVRLLWWLLSLRLLLVMLLLLLVEVLGLELLLQLLQLKLLLLELLCLLLLLLLHLLLLLLLSWVQLVEGELPGLLGAGAERGSAVDGRVIRGGGVVENPRRSSHGVVVKTRLRLGGGCGEGRGWERSLRHRAWPTGGGNVTHGTCRGRGV